MSINKAAMPSVMQLSVKLTLYIVHTMNAGFIHMYMALQESTVLANWYDKTTRKRNGSHRWKFI